MKSLQKIGNSRGILIDKAILKLLKMEDNGSFEVELREGGIFLKPVSFEDIYAKKAKKHRKSPDKLGM